MLESELVAVGRRAVVVLGLDERFLPRALTCAASLVLLLGCGGGGSTDSSPTAPAVLTTIILSPSTRTLSPGNTVQLAAAPKDQHGNAISATITWTSSSETVALVSNTGFVTATGAGVTTITAASGAITGTSIVAVPVGTVGMVLLTNFDAVEDPPNVGSSPDLTIAAGSTKLVLARNNAIDIREKSGSLVASTTIRQFFDGVRNPSGTGLTDPWASFDPTSGRFFVANSQRVVDPTCAPGSCVAEILLAVSKNSNPTRLDSSDWYFYALDRTLVRTTSGTTATSYWGDFDKIGIVGDVVAISMNMVRMSDEVFVYTKVRLLDKVQLIRGEAMTNWVDVVGLPGSTLAAGTVGQTGKVFLFQGCDQVYAITASITAPSVESRSGNFGLNCASIPPAIQPDGAPPIFIVDASQPVLSNGSLWIAKLGGYQFPSGVVPGIAWAQLDVSAWPATPRVVQSGVIAGEGIANYGPQLKVNQSGDVVIVYQRSSAAEFPSVYYTGRSASDLPNTLLPSRLLKGGTSVFVQVLGSGRNAFVDYLGGAVDPSNDSFWIFGLYATGLRSGRAWAANVKLFR